MEKKKIIVPIVAGVATLGILTAASYAYFSAKVTIANDSQTETKVKSNKLGLIYTGVTDINVTDIIPGDYMTKTFTVENTSNHAVDYNIYMEDVENEFNADLVYTLTDQDGTVIEEGPLPTTATGKTYIKSKVSINEGVTKSYTLTIKFLYKENEEQNALQGASFNATLGIDTEGVATPSTPTKAWVAVTGDGSQVGDEIAVGDEHFYVISNDGTTLNALAKYNLNAGNMCTSSSSCTPIENPTYKQDEIMTGAVYNGSWSYGYGSLAFSNTNGWPYSNNDTIDIQAYDGSVKTAINAYKEILPEGIEVRLITKAEIEALVNDGATLSYCSIKDKADAKGVSWVYSTSYWSGSADAVNDDYVWLVNSNGYFNFNNFFNDIYYGVRPVISLES